MHYSTLIKPTIGWDPHGGGKGADPLTLTRQSVLEKRSVGMESRGE